jgi:hypothetical protein
VLLQLSKQIKCSKLGLGLYHSRIGAALAYIMESRVDRYIPGCNGMPFVPLTAVHVSNLEKVSFGSTDQEERTGMALQLNLIDSLDMIMCWLTSSDNLQ